MSKKDKILFYVLSIFLIIECTILTAIFMLHPEYGIIGDLCGTALIVYATYVVCRAVFFTKRIIREY